MARTINRLVVKRVTSLPAGKYNDGGGLWLVKSDRDTGNWVARVSVAGRRRELGLGSIHHTSLSEARKLARAAQSRAREGHDPVAEKQERLRALAARSPAFADVLDRLFASKRAGLKGSGHNGRLLSPLTTHVVPKLGRRDIASIGAADIRDTLAPIWIGKANAARKALQRTDAVLKFAAAEGHNVDLQAAPKAKQLLGAQGHKIRHVEALHWRDVPRVYADLAADFGLAALCLRLQILTGVRPGEARGARLSEIDRANGIWTIGAERMKAGVPFRVPLCQAALSVVAEAVEFERDGTLFPGRRAGTILSDMAAAQHMKRRGFTARPHGFRSALRDWLADEAKAPWHAAEACLAHIVGSQTSRAYARSDHIDDRRALLHDWAGHVTGSIQRLEATERASSRD